MSIIESQLKKFEEIVDQEFGFLKKFGFKRTELQKIDFEYPQDKRVEINYFSDSLCVTVRWFLTYANLEVGLIELVNKRMPKKISFYGDSGYGRAISLYDLVELLTKGEEKDPLQNPHSKASVKEIMIAWKNRDKLIHSDLHGLISKYARALETYGNEVLDGDLSIFIRVQNYSKSKL